MKRQCTPSLIHQTGKSLLQEGITLTSQINDTCIKIRADNMVIIWTNDGKPISSYKHSKKIQSVSFNPLLQTVI